MLLFLCMNTFTKATLVAVLNLSFAGISAAAEGQAFIGPPIMQTGPFTDNVTPPPSGPLIAPRVLPTMSEEEYAAAKAAAAAQAGSRVSAPTDVGLPVPTPDPAKPLNPGNAVLWPPALIGAPTGAPIPPTGGLEMPLQLIAPPPLPTISREEYAAAKAAAAARLGDRQFLLNPDSNPTVPPEVAKGIEVKFQFMAAPGKQYRVESSEQLSPTSWQPMEGTIAGSGTAETIGVAVSTSHRFFRVVEVP